ncbi:MAG: hypothetical protein RR840_11250 [Clostridium sp.]
MKVKYLYLNIFFAVVYSTLSFISAPSITVSFIIKTLLLSIAAIFVGYVLDSKSLSSTKNPN